MFYFNRSSSVFTNIGPADYVFAYFLSIFLNENAVKYSNK